MLMIISQYLIITGKKLAPKIRKLFVPDGSADRQFPPLYTRTHIHTYMILTCTCRYNTLSERHVYIFVPLPPLILFLKTAAAAQRSIQSAEGHLARRHHTYRNRRRAASEALSSFLLPLEKNKTYFCKKWHQSRGCASPTRRPPSSSRSAATCPSPRWVSHLACVLLLDTYQPIIYFYFAGTIRFSREGVRRIRDAPSSCRCDDIGKKFVLYNTRKGWIDGIVLLRGWLAVEVRSLQRVTVHLEWRFR